MLTRAVILTALLAFGNANPVTPVYDTIVVGMGASGTAAAAALAQAGKKVLALEAQDRIGGRVYTAPFGSGIVEIGAEWIHGSEGSRTYELAIQNNITILAQDVSLMVYRSDGSRSDSQLIDELVSFALEATDDPPEKPEPLGQFLTRRITDYIREHHPTLLADQDFITQLLYFMDLVIDTYEASNSWNDVTTHSNFVSLKGNQNLSWNTYGYKTLFEILLNTFKNGPGYPTLDIKLRKVVSKISYPQQPDQDVAVTCEDGSVYRARNVIVTVSIGVLKERHATLFSPVLPQSKVTAIDNISMGVIGKVILLFPYRWWKQEKSDHYNFLWKGEDRQALDGDWSTMILGVTTPMGNKNAMTVWTSGEIAKLTLFSPPLPAAKIEAFESISFGAVGKIILNFDQIWWDPNIVFYAFIWKDEDRKEIPYEDRWLLTVDGIAQTMGCNTTISVWTIGDGTRQVETLPDDVVQTKVMALVRKFLGKDKTIPEPVEMIRSKWFTNPYVRGTYTYDNLDTPQHPNARAVLGEPILDNSGAPRVLFAGEATEVIHFSTVHGAIEAGQREANRLLAKTN